MNVRAACLAILLAVPLFGGEPDSIEDSNFFAESGWNRDDSVVQLNTFHQRGTTAFELTHEWAAGSSRHQVSYTIPVFRRDESGLGDARINYRYQWGGSEERGWGIAPRLSLILPTRSPAFGSASSGIELGIPLSVSWRERWSSHTNAHFTWFRDRGETEWVATQNISFSASDRVAFSLETAFTRCGGGSELFVARPGIQFTLDGPRGLRLAPGIALPLGSNRGVLFFLAVERGVSP
jgi:hypothetical protein